MTILRKNPKCSYCERHPIADPSQNVYISWQAFCSRQSVRDLCTGRRELGSTCTRAGAV